MWEINGLPLHPLVVHAAVVLGPLAALAAIAYVGLPRHRDLFRWVALVTVLLATGAVWAAYLTGNNFYAQGGFDHFSQKIQDRIATHEGYARTLRWITTGFAVVTVLASWLHARTGAARLVMGLLVVVGAVLTLAWIALTGEAGARAVWGK
jgi:1,4-dihydroxy-2-naphthoate octaprenyltransferase